LEPKRPTVSLKPSFEFLKHLQAGNKSLKIGDARQHTTSTRLSREKDGMWGENEEHQYDPRAVFPEGEEINMGRRYDEAFGKVYSSRVVSRYKQGKMGDIADRKPRES
jgi:hypothetical protein